MTTGDSDEHNKSKFSSEIGNPAGRGGEDADMAATILLLAGRGGLFYNEQILYPDGGETPLCCVESFDQLTDNAQEAHWQTQRRNE